MLKRILYLAVILTFSCSSETDKEKTEIDLNINFNTSSTVILHYKNAQDSTFFKTNFYNFLPSDYISSKNLLPNGNGKKTLSFKIQHPKKIDLSYGEFMSSCFLIPNDTLEIYIDLDTTQNIKNNIKFKGKYASINEFYNNKELHFNKIDSELRVPGAIAFNSQNTIAEYTAIMDSLTKIELDFLNNYRNKNSLPQWFIDYETTQIKSAAEASKLIVVPYRKDFLKQEINIPENYFSTIKTYMEDCPNSILSNSRFYYLLNDFQHTIDFSKKPTDSIDNTSNYNNRLIELSLKNLDEVTSDIFLTIHLDMIIEHGRLNDSIYTTYYNAIRNKEFKTYLDSRKEIGEILKPGDNAPAFMLPNINGKEYQLKDFRGSFIYLSFWFSGCKPCLSEFPDENGLVEEFKGENVKFINICTLTSKDNWKSVSKKYNLKMINLYANNTLDNFIEKNYDITAYPHHVLIDKEGKIIKNKCSKANKIKETIYELLKND